MHDTDVVVIGAGAAGVAAGRRLAAAKVRTVVLEARSRVGGRAWTMRGEGLPPDLGCGWLPPADENEGGGGAAQLGRALKRTPPPRGARRWGCRPPSWPISALPPTATSSGYTAPTRPRQIGRRRTSSNPAIAGTR